MHICPTCQTPFISKSARDAHYMRHNKTEVYNCNIRLKPFKNMTAKHLHERCHNQEINQEGGNLDESDVVVDEEIIDKNN